MSTSHGSERETERERENERVTVAERSSILCDPRLELARNIIYGRSHLLSLLKSADVSVPLTLFRLA